MKHRSRQPKLWTAAAAAVLLAGCGANDTDGDGEGGWPHDEMTIIVPTEAGGSIDAMARELAPYLEEELDVDVQIENHPGAGHQIGIRQFIDGPDDGSTVLATGQMFLSASQVLRGADYGYDVTEFPILSFQMIDPVAITVHRDSPFDSLEDIVEAAEENPGSVSYVTMHGGHGHLVGVLLEDAFDVDLAPVFADSGSDTRNMLLGQHADFMINNIVGDLAIEDNAKVIAGAADDDHPALDLWADDGAVAINSVIADHGGEEIPDVASSRFLAAHPNLAEESPELLDQLEEAYQAAFEHPEHQERLEEIGQDAVSEWHGSEWSQNYNQEMHETMQEYASTLEAHAE